jgi:CTP synthase
MRLGPIRRTCCPGLVVARVRTTAVDERHRHRYEVNNAYREPLEAGRASVRHVAGRSLVEFVELPADVHPYYVATQAHPEFRSRPTRPHPLFTGLVRAALARQSDG